MQKSCEDEKEVDFTPVTALPESSTPLMTEAMFNYTAETPQQDTKPSTVAASPLVKCSSCNVCVHACELPYISFSYLMLFFGPSRTGSYIYVNLLCVFTLIPCINYGP